MSGESSVPSVSATERLLNFNFLRTYVLGMGTGRLRPEQVPNQTAETR